MHTTPKLTPHTFNVYYFANSNKFGRGKSDSLQRLAPSQKNIKMERFNLLERRGIMKINDTDSNSGAGAFDSKIDSMSTQTVKMALPKHIKRFALEEDKLQANFKVTEMPPPRVACPQSYSQNRVHSYAKHPV